MGIICKSVWVINFYLSLFELGICWLLLFEKNVKNVKVHGIEFDLGDIFLMLRELSSLFCWADGIFLLRFRSGDKLLQLKHLI